MAPTISAISPYFKASGTIEAAIASVRSQSHPPDEIIVVDDSSSPAEAAILGHLGPDVRVLRTERNSGSGAAKRLGSEVATSEWLAYLDADDAWVQNKLERQIEFSSRHSDTDAVHCGTIVWKDGVDVKQYIAKPSVLRAEMAPFGGNVLASALLIRRDSLLRVGNWNDNIMILDDWDLTIRMLAAGMVIRFQPEALTRFRRDGHASMTADLWYDLVLHLACLQHHRQFVIDTVGVKGLRQARARCLYRLGRRYGGGAGRLIAWGAALRGGKRAAPPE